MPPDATVSEPLTLARGHGRFCRRDTARTPIPLRLEFSGQDHRVSRKVEASHGGLVHFCADLLAARAVAAGLGVDPARTVASLDG